MDRISFSHFFNEVKYTIEPKFLVFINPESQVFFKVKGVYFALTINGDDIYVNMMIGNKSNNIDGLREFIIQVKQIGFKYLRFGTVEGNKDIIPFYRYIGAKHTKTTPNYYIDGSNYVEYELKLDEMTRFK